jgi:hypothetical protein
MEWMMRIRVWGLLLLLAVPLLVWFNWSQVHDQQLRINAERFADSNAMQPVLTLLYERFKQTGRVAVAGDVALPEPPKPSGVKAWHVRDDGVLAVELQAKSERAPAVVYFVPVVGLQRSLGYDCVTTTALQRLIKSCDPRGNRVVQSVAGIASQVRANEQTVAAFAPLLDSTGAAVPEGIATGAVYVVPPRGAGFHDCGMRCVKLQRCINLRRIACMRLAADGTDPQEPALVTPSTHRGSDLATRADADKACQVLGADYRVAGLNAATRGAQLVSGDELWIHSEPHLQKNCWTE